MNRRRSILKFPLYRDGPLQNALEWIEKKKEFDNIGNMWRIHDGLYDLTDFVQVHPGGAQWIALSRGTDITEAFETHHLQKTPEKLLPKFLVRSANTPRNSAFTFKEDGFYKTLKGKVAEKLSEIPSSARKKSDKITDSLLLITLILSPLSSWSWKLTVDDVVTILLVLVNSAVLGLLVTCAHNYFHRADNWRMYLFNLNGLSFENWRITHSMSHHLFTNTSLDAELILFEPYLQYLPYKDKPIWSKLAVFYFPIVTTISFLVSLASALLPLKNQPMRWTNAIPFLLLIWMWLLGRQPLLPTLAIWISTCLISNLSFALFAITSGHLNSTNFFEGLSNNKEKIDWGLHQLRTIVERSSYTRGQFKALAMFGDHTLHHLFPTLDHGELHYLYPVLINHCKEFKVELRTTNFIRALWDQFAQLTSYS